MPRPKQGLRWAAYVSGLLGLVLLIGLVLRYDFDSMLGALESAGGALLWLIPYRLVYFLLYALGWFYLLRPYDPRGEAGLGYLFWVTTVREAIDRLLPVASIGGAVAGIRLVRWRGLSATGVSATVIAEILLTLIVSYVFAVTGLALLSVQPYSASAFRDLLFALLLALPVPLLTALLLRYGSAFARLSGVLHRLVGENPLSAGGIATDRELRACLGRTRTMLVAGGLQFAALVSGSLEIWFALRLFGHPVGVADALILESLNQGLRHAAFFVPGALGVQEAGLVLIGHMMGINAELALAVSVAKRFREVLCGLPSLLSWQWLEGRRLRNPLRNAA